MEHLERGDAPAVRFKQHGRLHTQSWSSLVEGAPQRGHTLGLNWVQGLLSSAQRTEAPWRREDVVWIEPALLEREPRLVGMWLQSGAVLAVDETRDGDDRRELAPTVVIASAAYYAKLQRETEARLQRSVLHSLARWAFARPRHPVSRALILRPIADQLGLARVRSLLTVEPTSLAWFEALRLERAEAPVLLREIPV